MLLEGKPQTEIALQLGVHFNTIGNWKKNEAYKEELSRQRKEMTKSAYNIFAGKAEYAARRIVEMIDDKEVNRIQFSAACKVFDTATATSVEDFEKRIEELEDKITREV